MVIKLNKKIEKYLNKIRPNVKHIINDIKKFDT